MNTWLIRRADLTFVRPLSKAALVDMIESGEVQSQDEVCESKGYWFSIQEVDEVRKHFGDIRLQALMPDASETTSATNTRPLTKTAQKVMEELKKDASPVIAPQTTAKPKVKTISDEAPSRHALFFGLLLTLIFVGTLVFLWMGSH